MVGDVHDIFTKFKAEFPEVYRLEEELGQHIHTQGGPLGEPTRWLLKVAISAAAGRHRALETHLVKAREAGVSEEELRQVLLLLIPTVGFPGFMEAYQTYKGLRS
jgi:alkylhydroperoxidase/carboxymuconolactone decarboxylase family protein YurZ